MKKQVTKVTVEDILTMLKEDLRARRREFNRHRRSSDYTQMALSSAVFEYVVWLIEHLEYWIEHGEQP